MSGWAAEHLPAAGAVGIFVSVYLLAKLLDAVTKTNEHLGNLRFRVGRIDDQQEKTLERLEAIEGLLYRQVRQGSTGNR